MFLVFLWGISFFLGFIVVAACVMTFEARDSAAKVVPARFKMNSASVSCGHVSHGGSGHGSLRTSGSQTATLQHQHPQPDRRAITQSFMQFSKGLALETPHSNRGSSLKVPQVRNTATFSSDQQQTFAISKLKGNFKFAYQKPFCFYYSSLLFMVSLSVKEKFSTPLSKRGNSYSSNNTIIGNRMDINKWWKRNVWVN